MPVAPGNRPQESSTCAFCRIIRGEEQASLVFEDSLSLAFLTTGHFSPAIVCSYPRRITRRWPIFPSPWSGRCFRTRNCSNRPLNKD